MRDQVPFGLAAIAAHAAIAAVLPEVIAPPAIERAVPDGISIEIEFEAVLDPPPPFIAFATAPPSSSQRATARPREGAARPPMAAAASPALVPESADATVDLVVPPEVPIAPSTQRPPLVPIDPESVARAAIQDWGEIARPGPGAPLEAPPIDEEAQERALSEDLRARAMTKAFGTRHEIELAARPDGSHVYRGIGFTAIIRRDGSVEFRDRDAASIDGVQAQQVEAPGHQRSSVIPELLQGPGGGVGAIPDPPMIAATIGGTMDPDSELLRAAGQDPWAAERMRFLEETEELRAELEDRHAAEVRALAMRRLPARLARIWGGSGSAEVRRRRIFEVWDACDEDDAGIAARRRIERFVREHLPRGSPDAFSDAELARCNDARASTEPFAPY